MAYDLLSGKTTGRDWGLGNGTIKAQNIPLSKFNPADPIISKPKRGIFALAVGTGILGLAWILKGGRR